MSFLTRLLLVTLLSGPCIPQNQKESILLTLKSIAAKQDSLLQKFDVLDDKVLAHQELLDDKFLEKDEQLETLKLSVGRCSTKHQISTFHDSLATGKDSLATFHDSLATDIDECKDESNVCGDEEVCINLPDGNYTCICQDGYEKQGDICQDVNECRQPHICPEDQKCANLPGSYKCFVCTLPSLELETFGCISYVEEDLTWSDAQDKCNADGGSLLYGFNKQQLITISEHFDQHYSYYMSGWVGVRGGLFVKSPSDDGPPGGTSSSSPDASLWANDEPNGALGDNTQCGKAFLTPSYNPDMWDYNCMSPEYSLCQILY